MAEPLALQYLFDLGIWYNPWHQYIIFISMTAAAATSALLFQSTNPGTALGGRRQQSYNSTNSSSSSIVQPRTTTSDPQTDKASAPSNGGGGVVAGGTLRSSTPRLFKSDAANNYYNAIKMKNALQTKTNANNNDGNNNNLKPDLTKDDAAPSKMNSNAVAAIVDGGATTEGREQKKTTFANNIAVLSPPNSLTQQQGNGDGGGEGRGGIIPPITSFDWSCAGGDQRDILSATSSITHCDSFLHPNDSFCSITTEEATAAAAAASTTGLTNSASQKYKKHDERSSDDPPIAEYPSPICKSSPDDNATTYDSCVTHAASAVVLVPKELTLDVIAEGSETENGRSTTSISHKNYKEMDESIEQDLQSYQATSSSTMSNEKLADVAETSTTNAVKPPPRDEISHALNVVNALSIIGSAAVSKKPAPDKITNHAIVPSMKLRSVRSMSPSLFKKKKYPTEKGEGKGGEVTSSSSAKSIVLAPNVVTASSLSSSPSSSSSSLSPPRASKSMHSVRSMSPSFFHSERNNKDEETKKKNSSDSESDGSTAASTVSTSGTNPAEAPSERIDSTSTPSLSATEKKGTKDTKKAEAKGTNSPIKSKNRALPPLIPARAIKINPPCQPQQIITSPDDDGSVECSVKAVSNDNKDVTPPEVSATNGHKDAQIVAGESTIVISNTVTDDSGSCESSLFKGLELDEVIPKLDNVNPSTKGRKERARERLARRQPKISAGVVDMDEKSAKNFIPASLSEDKSNISTSIASDKSRKKEKLQKIMDYRKKASPAHEQKLPQKTLDAWLVPREKKKVKKASESFETSNADRNVQNETQSKSDIKDVMVASQNSKQEEVKMVKGSQESGAPMYVEAKMKNMALVEGSELKKVMIKQTQQPKYSKPIIHSRDFSAPVSRIDVLQTAYSTDTGISLPPELLNGKKVRIWQESETFDEGMSKDDGNVEALADVFMTCGKPNDDVFTDMNTDVNSIIVERKAWCANDDESTLNPKRNNVAMCGVDTHQLKHDIIFEVNEVVRDVEDGVRRSMRNLFLTCDITQGGGVEAVTSNVANTNDQIFGRAPIPTKQPQPISDMKEASNTTVKKNASIFDSAVAARKLSKDATVLPNKLGQRKEKPITADEKRTMYVAKLRAASLKHM